MARIRTEPRLKTNSTPLFAGTAITIMASFQRTSFTKPSTYAPIASLSTHADRQVGQCLPRLLQSVKTLAFQTKLSLSRVTMTHKLLRRRTKKGLRCGAVVVYESSCYPLTTSTTWVRTPTTCSSMNRPSRKNILVSKILCICYKGKRMLHNRILCRREKVLSAPHPEQGDLPWSLRSCTPCCPTCK